MYNRMHQLTHEQIQMLHDASMDLLKNTGIKFHEPEAVEIFTEKPTAMAIAYKKAALGVRSCSRQDQPR